MAFLTPLTHGLFMTKNYQNGQDKVKSKSKSFINTSDDDLIILEKMLQKPYIDVDGIYYPILKEEMEKRGLTVGGND